MSSPEHLGRSVLDHVEARELLGRLVSRGVRLVVRRGVLATMSDPALLSEDDRAQLAFLKWEIAVLVLAGDDRLIDRLVHVERPRGGDGSDWPASCVTCGDALPRGRVRARCGWCALAARLHAGAPVTPDVLDMFDETIVGPRALRTAGPDLALRFDEAVPA